MVATKAFLLAVIALFSLSASADKTVDRLFELINERLGYMVDVALYKARHQLPIEDPPREQKVVAAAQRQAASLELDAASVQDFFLAQIAVAKAIQYRCRADLLTETSLKTPPDLQREIRPVLIRLGDQITRQLAVSLRERGVFQPADFPVFDKVVSANYLTLRDKQLLFNALLKVKRQAVSN